VVDGGEGGPPIPVRVFISYRREDTRGYAGRLYDSLLQRLEPGQVFMDIDNIEPGVDFVDVLTETVDRADVELVLIGPTWATVTNASGRRRLDDPNDFVRLETEAALRRGIRVIPILFGGAVMPSADQLPESMAALSRRNALEISDARWRFDVSRLLDAIEAVGRAQAPEAQAAEAQVVEPMPPPAPAPEQAPRPEPEPAPEPVGVPPVARPESAAPPPGGRNRLILLGGAGAAGVAAVVIGAILLTGGPPDPGGSPSPSTSAAVGSTGSPGASIIVGAPLDLTFAVDLPSDALAERLGNAVELAVTEREADLLAAGYRVTVTTSSHGVDNEPNEVAGVENAEAIVADGSVVAMIGPRNTRIAVPQLPITNDAGLPQCVPGTGYPPLTRPDAGALELRGSRPDEPNLFRPIASDDLEGSAAAQYALEALAATTAIVVTDTSEFGDHLSDGFRDAFAAGGGTPAERLEIDPIFADYGSAIALIGDADVVFLGTDQTPVTADFRIEMVEAGLQAIPLLAGSSIVHAPGAAAVSYFELAGAAAEGTYAAAGGHMEAPGMSAFATAYRAAYGEGPTDETAIGYACGQVLVQALIETTPAAAIGDLREALRAAIVGSGATFDTVLGSIGFDANGDTTEPVTRVLRADPAAAGGVGDWALAEEIEHPPVPDLGDAHLRAG
jgi:ABC-type branched-subunit amino acid transport system substrate-binding protein